jgi:glyoxylase-like metal-dependent hydrolase (beta-lactamase superfamily II)
MALHFDRSLDVPAGLCIRLSPLVERVLAPNPGPFTFRGTGVYLVGAGAHVAVIDPGPAIPEHLEDLKRALGSRTVSHILVTHTHNDHSPAAAPLKAWSGAKTYAAIPPPPHAGEVSAASPAMRHAEREKEGVVDEAHDRAFMPDVTLRDGDIVGGDGFTLEAVATPGHTADHLCYALLEAPALFSGDHVMGWSTSVIAPPDGDMAQYIASLERLALRDEPIFYPTHGSPIAAPQAPSPQDFVRELIAHRRQRAAQIAAALARGQDSVAALVDRLYPDVVPALRPAAAAQVRAHLDQMLRAGAVVRDGLSYRPSS